MGRPKKLSDDDLLEQAFTVISREGFESFTLEQVAKTVGLSPAALIKRFGTKERLARAARDRKWDVNMEQMATGGVRPTRGLAALFHFVRLIARSVDSKRLGEHMRLLGTQAGDFRSKKKVAAYFQGTRDRIAACLKEACEDRDLQPPLDTEKTAFTLEALIQGSIFQFGFLDARDVEAHLMRHVQTFLEPYRRGV